MIKSIKTEMARFFFERKTARKIVYASSLLAGLILMLIKVSSPTFKEILIAAVAYPLVAGITYLVFRLSMILTWVFTNKTGIYQLNYWFGLIVVAVALVTMALPTAEMREADIFLLVGLSISWSARATYFDYQKKKTP